MRSLRLLSAGLLTTVFAIVPPLAEGHAETSPAPPPRACDHGYVALTFDDGPSATTTAILQALHDNGLTRATFFNIGAQEQLHPALVMAEQAAGDWPGDHTYSHPFLDELTTSQAAGELLGTQQIHEQITGVRESLFRPPFGRTTPEIRALARSMGMTEVLWTIDTQDYAGATTAQIVAAALAAHRGDIILMHDAGYATTVAAVPPIIRGLADRGMCAGRVVPTRHPVTAWPGTTFFASAARW